MDNYLKVLEVLNGIIKEIEETLEEKAEVTEEAKWLMSTPGIGFHNALLMLSELGEHVRYGHINKHSNGLSCYPNDA